MHHFDNAGRADLFGKVSVRPATDRVEQLLFVIVSREDHRSRAGRFFSHALNDLQAVQAGQVDIHQHHARGQLAGQLQSHFAVRRFTDDLDI